MAEIFAKHINFALERFENKFVPELLSIDGKKKLTLTNYQKFTVSVFLLESMSNLLLFWETGFGKTITCVYLIKNLFKIYPKWKIFIFIKSSLSFDPWKKTINEFIDDHIKNYIYYIHYDLNTEQLFLIKNNSITQEERVFFIFDEFHDFIKKLIPRDQKEKKLSKIYHPLIKSIKKKYNKVLCMTATPITDKKEEFNYEISLLRPGILTLKEEIFLDNNKLAYPNLLKNSIMGITSFQRRSNINLFLNTNPSDRLAGKNIIFHHLVMSDYQSLIYDLICNIEKKHTSKGFRILRRLASTFVYKNIKIKESLSEEKYIEMIVQNLSLYNKELNTIHFNDKFIFNIKNSRLFYNEDSSLTKNLNIKQNTKSMIDSSLSFEKKKNVDYEQLKILHSYSCKYIKTCQLILQSKGKCLIYQPFVTFEGIKTLLKMLEKFNITYIEYSKNTKKTRDELITNFNKETNILGTQIKCCVLSSVGSEGISFNNILDLVVMDIPWSGSNLEQIIGRAIRLDSHASIPKENRIVNIHILISYSKNTNNSVDLEILKIIENKETFKSELINLFSSVSIENIHKAYPFITPVSKENLFPYCNIKYNPKEEIQNQVAILKSLISIFYSFNEDYSIIYSGYLDEKTNNVFHNNLYVGDLIFENNKKKFKIIEDKLVYLIKPIY